MTEDSQLYWYTFDVLPLTGYVRAPDEDSARLAAVDVATNRVREYLSESPVTLEPVTTTEEATRDAEPDA